jgi:hypothetical protein
MKLQLVLAMICLKNGSVGVKQKSLTHSLRQVFIARNRDKLLVYLVGSNS